MFKVFNHKIKIIWLLKKIVMMKNLLLIKHKLNQFKKMK